MSHFLDSNLDKSLIQYTSEITNTKKVIEVDLTGARNIWVEKRIKAKSLEEILNVPRKSHPNIQAKESEDEVIQIIKKYKSNELLSKAVEELWSSIRNSFTLPIAIVISGGESALDSYSSEIIKYFSIHNFATYKLFEKSEEEVLTFMQALTAYFQSHQNAIPFYFIIYLGHGTKTHVNQVSKIKVENMILRMHPRVVKLVVDTTCQTESRSNELQINPGSLQVCETVKYPVGREFLYFIGV